MYYKPIKIFFLSADNSRTLIHNTATCSSINLMKHMCRKHRNPLYKQTLIIYEAQKNKFSIASIGDFMIAYSATSKPGKLLLNLYHSMDTFSRYQFDDTSFIFPRKIVLGISCKLSPKDTICMKKPVYFPAKIRYILQVGSC